MSVSVYQIQSSLSQVTQDHVNAYLASIEKELNETLELVDIEAFQQAPFGLMFVASGGSEGIFLSKYDMIADRPLYILTSGESNSLAASMEILSYLQQQGKQGEIIHGSVKDVAQRIQTLRKALTAKAQLKGTRTGLIGEKSDWLIASSDDGTAYEAKLGITLVPVEIEELVEEYNKKTYVDNQWTQQLKSYGYDSVEIERALNVYGALRRLVDKYSLSAVTLRCFDLLSSIQTTGCLALAILNAEGIYAGCEGDVPAIISMEILGAVSGNPIFLCNPSRIDTAKGEMVLAHCTLPMNMPKKLRLTTHYESDIGVAIAGEIDETECTIFKTSAALDRHFVKAGTIVENLHEAHLCRTQIKLQLDDFSYFLTKPINNHHLVCLGDHTAAIQEFFTLLDA